MSKIYIGAMNDALFLLDGPPRPGPYDGPIPNLNGPNALTKGFPSGCEEQLQQIVAAWNTRITALEAERDALRKALGTAIERLEASLFTNSEHAQSADILRAAIMEDKSDEV